jgi:hypothetical protein
MTTEYYLQEGDTHESLARDLLEQAANPEQVVWRPRPDVFGGGVYELADEAIAQRVREVRAARRRDEAAQIEASQKAAEDRDSHEDVASGLLTPAEAGFPANAGTDPGSAREAEEAEEADDEEVVEDEADDEPSEGDDEPRLTPAQKRAATRAEKAKKQAEAKQAAADEEKSE